jgi:S1-C subfamily serine protease
MLGARFVVLFVVFFSFTIPAFGGDKSVQLETSPPGAQVEINRNVVCTTPCAIQVESSYFGKKHTALSAHASQPIRVRFTKEGYVPKDVELTGEPIHWENILCRTEGSKCENSYDYYLLTADRFTFQLDPVSTFISTNEAPKSETSAVGRSDQGLSTEDMVQDALPAVVQVSARGSTGSGFFVTADGVVVTNAHVVSDEASVMVTTSSGKQLQSTDIYVDQDRDLALIKVPIAGNSFLGLNLATPAAGSDVIAIGTPGAHDVTGILRLPNTVTKGVVSGIRRFSDGTAAGVPGRGGVWIQTDATINHGNSGGPLLNRSGEVIGINTLSFAGTGTPGLNFALAASELAQILQYRFGVKLGSTDSIGSSVAGIVTATTAMLSITSNPGGAEIEVDGVFLGSTPAELPLLVGQRTIAIAKKGYKTYQRKVQVLAGSKQTISVVLEVGGDK